MAGKCYKCGIDLGFKSMCITKIKCNSCKIKDEISQCEYLPMFIDELSINPQGVGQTLQEFADIAISGFEFIKAFAQGGFAVMFKETSVGAFFLVTVQITCEKCSGKYYYLTWVRKMGSSYSFPGKDSQKMIVRALDKSIANMIKDIQNKRFGYAPCPHCGYIPNWMFKGVKYISHRNWFLFEIKTFWGRFQVFLVSAIALAIGLGITYIMDENDEASFIVTIILSYIICFYYFMKRKRKIVWDKDYAVRIKTEAEMAEHVIKCKKENKNPYRQWYLDVLMKQDNITSAEAKLHINNDDFVMTLGIISQNGQVVNVDFNMNNKCYDKSNELLDQEEHELCFSDKKKKDISHEEVKLEPEQSVQSEGYISTDFDNYIVNKNSQKNGEHEVHKVGCKFMPKPENCVSLGRHPDGNSAVAMAKVEFYHNSDGCKFCSPESHTK